MPGHLDVQVSYHIKNSSSKGIIFDFDFEGGMCYQYHI